MAAIVAVLGLAQSSEAELLAEISKLGTNLLTVTNGQSLTGGTAELPIAAPGMVGELHGVTAVQYTGELSNVNAYHSPYVPSIDTNAMSVDASSIGLPAVVGTSVAQGTYLNAATDNEPVAVLGYQAAQRLGIDRIRQGEKIWVGGMWFYVVGILNPATLAPLIDSSILIGFPAAQKYLGFDGHPSELYVRTQNDQSSPLPSTASSAIRPIQRTRPGPACPSPPARSRPGRSRGRVRHPLPGTRRGRAAGRRRRCGQHHDHLGAGTASGDRAAAGAGRHPGQIRIQFLSEAILLSLIGGAAGVIIGVISTAVYAHTKGWAIVIPPEAWAGGLGAALAIGAIAGLLPAIRAARLSPTQALWSL